MIRQIYLRECKTDIPAGMQNLDDYNFVCIDNFVCIFFNLYRFCDFRQIFLRFKLPQQPRHRFAYQWLDSIK